MSDSWRRGPRSRVFLAVADAPHRAWMQVTDGLCERRDTFETVVDEHRMDDLVRGVRHG